MIVSEIEKHNPSWKASLCENLWRKKIVSCLINNYPGKSENLKPQWSLRSPLLCFLFKSSPPKLFSKVAVLKFRRILWKTPAMDFCFRCRAKTIISTEIELRSMLPLEFWTSYFLDYRWLIAVPKAAIRGVQESTCVGGSFNKVTGLRACKFSKKRLHHRLFHVNIGKFLRTSFLKNICERLLCVSLLFHLLSCSKFLQNFASCSAFVLRDIFCVISVDNKI